MRLMENVLLVTTTVKPVTILKLVFPTNVTILVQHVMANRVVIVLPVPLGITKRKNVIIGKEILFVLKDVHTNTIFWENIVFPVILHAGNVMDLHKVIANLVDMERS